MEKTRRTMSEVSSPILSELMKILFLAISNPLYFSYFIFFSPYIYKLFSFLSPLFLTTTLLVLALITTTKLSLTSQKVNDNEDEDEDEEHFPHNFQDSEVYKLVFDTASLESKQSEGDDVVVIKETCSEEPVLDIKCLIIQESNNTIDFDSSKKVVVPRVDEKSCFGSPVWDLDEDKYTVVKNSKSSSSSSHVDVLDDIDIEIDGGDHSPSGFGSMRKEKEWRRTLACKLFEERHNGAGEEMDLLWETYEAEQSNDKAQLKNDSKSKHKYNNKMRRNNTNSSSSSSGTSVISSISCSSKGIIMNNNNNKGLVAVDNDHNYSDYEDDYEDETNGQLCCLQALKFSAGKMSLGMGKPSVVRFSKAFKGIGWLQNVARHAKKRYNNNNNNRD